MHMIMVLIIFLVWISAATATSIALIKDGHWIAGTIVFMVAIAGVKIKSGD